jgi:hypothetical protein
MTLMKFGGFSLALFAITFLALGGFATEAQTQEKCAPSDKAAATGHPHTHVTGLACAAACSDCQRSCDGCATHCAHLLFEGQKAHFATLATCQDCATVCAAASQIVARGGPFSHVICTACADACERCAKECEKFPGDMHMKACAQECRKCEKACREMLKASHVK